MTLRLGRLWLPFDFSIKSMNVVIPTTKTLVILSPGFPKDEEDSTCLPAQQIFVRALNQLYPGLKIVICAFEYPFLDGSYSWYGNTVYSFDGWNKGKLGKLLVWSRVWRKLNTLKRENSLSGILSFWLGDCALVGKYYCGFHRLRHLCWILGQDARKDNRYFRWSSPKPGELVALSDFLEDELTRNFDVKPDFIIPNGIDAAQFSDVKAERDIDLLGVGSLIPLKQYNIFIELVGQLKMKKPTVRAIICGKGPEEEYLETKIEEMGLQDNLILTGEKNHPEVLRLMQRSKVLFHPSSYEGFSSVCLEALYAGAHVVSFFSPMKKKINHWHIAQDRQEIFRLVEKLVNDPDASHESVLPYPIQESARAMMKLFDSSM